MPHNVMIRICPETIFRRTVWFISALVGASLIAAFLHLELGHPRLFGLADLVHLDRERNLPTLFSMVQLLAAGALAWTLGGREKPWSLRWLWRFLGAGLIWIGIDEAMVIHEKANRVDIGVWREISYFHFAWVVPAFVVVAVCGAIMLKLLLSLPRRTAAMFALSGAIFVAGSLGMEMLGGHFNRLHGRENWSYTLCYTIEETLEMLGPALFILTGLRYALTSRAAVIESEPAASEPVLL